MQLDSVQAVIRPRSAWEAADLGILMAVRWWWPMLKPWLVITLPVYVLLLFMPGGMWIGPLVFWWLKPLWERIHLFIVSRALFGEVPTLAAALRAFPKLLPPRLFAALLWGRINVYRSMDAPVMQLEGLTGGRYRQRIRLLHAEDDTPARYLTVAGAGIETLLFLAAAVLVQMLVPAELDSTVGETVTAEESAFTQALQYMLAYVATTLVAPFYVAGGFALYLNRRVKMEAWDIEIAFRKLAAARKPQGMSFVKVALLVCACMLQPGAPGTQLFAAEAPPGADILAVDPDAAAARAEAVMARAEFHERDLRQTPQMDPAFAARIARWVEALLEFLGRNERPDSSLIFAQFVEIVLWAALLGIVAALVWHYRSLLRDLVPHRRVANTVTTAHESRPAAGIDTRDTSLPDDVAAACRALWQSGDKLAAVALLYRAALVVFMRAYRFEFADSATEGEHLARVRATVPPAAGRWFMAVSRMWLFIAYGRRAPEESELLALCDGWQREWQQALQPQAGVDGGGAA